MSGQPELQAGDGDQGLVVAGEFVVAGGQGFVVLELVEAALDDVAAPVGGSVELAAALAAPDAAVDLVDPLRNRGLDAAPAQVGADLRGRVALVSDDLLGRVLGRPGPHRLTLMRAMTCSNWVQSLTFPPVIVKASGRPCPSQARWIFVVSPLRDRPIASPGQIPLFGPRRHAGEPARSWSPHTPRSSRQHPRRRSAAGRGPGAGPRCRRPTSGGSVRRPSSTDRSVQAGPARPRPWTASTGSR